MFFLGMLFRRSLMFVSKARAYPSKALFWCSTLGYVPGFTHKHWSKWEMPARDKHYSLLWTLINYDRKKFSNIGSCGLYYKRITIINDDSSVINKSHLLLTDDARVIIYYCNMLIKQAIGVDLMELFCVIFLTLFVNWAIL